MQPAFIKTVILSASLLLLSACTNGVLETVRKVTYPPDFNYIPDQKLLGTMNQFAWYSTLLDNNLRDTANITREQHENAIDTLKKMEKLSQQFGKENLSSNHNIVSFNIKQFQQNIRGARIGLQQDPPNYYLAGSVSAYCLNCHAQRGQ